MVDGSAHDWDPRHQAVLNNQTAAYDAMRQRCPVAHSDYQGWSLLRHADVVAVLEDHDTFSNAVSRHLSVPNGMDPPEHTVYRRPIDAYFAPERLAAFEPAFRRIASELVDAVVGDPRCEVMGDLAHPFAVRVQCAFMGWPERLREPLSRWIRRNQAATLAGDRPALAQLAEEFDGYIRELLQERASAGVDAPDDTTTRLLRERTDRGPLTTEEIVSIVRNWTAGELGTIAASVGILAGYVAEHPDVQQWLRERPGELVAAIDEILRLDAPLMSNRRTTTRAVDVGGRRIGEHELVTILWPSANRDESVFGDPDRFDPGANAARNLLYGAGVHACPGAPLARMELRVLMEELLDRTREIRPADGEPPVRAWYPAGGFSRLTLQLDGPARAG